MVITANTADVGGQWTPHADLPSIPILKPEWMISFGEPRFGHRASLRVITNPPDVAKTTPITRWGDQITGGAVLIEAWSWSKPAAHMVSPLAEKLSAVAPTAVLDKNQIRHNGAWPGR